MLFQLWVSIDVRVRKGEMFTHRSCDTMESLDIVLAPQAQSSPNKDERKVGLEFMTLSSHHYLYFTRIPEIA